MLKDRTSYTDFLQAPGGWFKEKVVAFEPHREISFELFECTLPVRRLKHDYTLIADGAGTLVRQRMEYELKLGLLGRLMDVVMVRRKWDAGIKGFFAGLKHHVEMRENRRVSRRA